MTGRQRNGGGGLRTGILIVATLTTLGVGLMGALLSTGVSVALHLRPEQRPVLMCAGAALPPRGPA